MARTRIVRLVPAFAWALALPALPAQPPNLHLVPKVNSERFYISYELDPGSAALGSVRLWYTTDLGQTWRQYGATSGTGTSMSFNAGEQGLYGFFVVAVSDAGPSSPPPGPSTEPHYWAYVDYTPPVVQLHPIEQRMPPSIPPVLIVRWSAIDNELIARPIELSYRVASDGAWESLDGPLANSGAFEWRVPDSVQGAVTIRVTVRDRGGHVVEDTSGAFTVVRPEPASLSPAGREGAASGDGARARTAAAKASSGTESDRGHQLFRQGQAHARRGEYALAVSRLTDALSADPQLTEALAELGRVLYAQGDFPRSIEAFKLALEQRPGSREVLEGMALAFIKERRFGDAVQHLSRIVQANPKDAEAWLNLGDIAVYQGDELLAREHYEKALTRDPTAADVIEKTKLRLSDLKRLAREFRQLEP